MSTSRSCARWDRFLERREEVQVIRLPSSIYRLTASVLPLLGACGDRIEPCKDCGTAVVAAIGEPASLVPPLVVETVGRDISDQIFERLAILEPGASPI